MAKREFKIIADIDNVAQMERDLAFHPCTNAHPTALTPNQIDHFNQKGYVTGLDVFDSTEVTDIRTYFDDLLDRVIASGKDSYSLSSAHLVYGRVYDLLKAPSIVDMVGDLLGDDVITTLGADATAYTSQRRVHRRPGRPTTGGDGTCGWPWWQLLPCWSPS